MSRKFFSSLGAFAAVLAFAVPAQADTKAGVDAWSKGEFDIAIREWQAAAMTGDADALYNLGQAFRLGKGVPQNLAKAEEMYGRAAALGHLQAADNYGLLIFQRGEQARAMPYISAAAGRGDPRAQYLLGIAHFNGQLVSKDWVRAYALVSLAQQQGVGPATAALKQMDGFIPLDQRQQGAQMAIGLSSQADLTRARQLAAAELGAAVPPTAQSGPANPAQARVASALPPVKVAPDDSPATAGADYARPAASPLPSRPALAGKPQSALPPVRTAAAVPAPAPRPPAAPGRAASASASAPANGPWRIQLGAFGVAANADAQWARLKGRPELGGHLRINVRTGAVTRLQAGGFASQAAAKAVCDKLLAAGTTCIATIN